MTSVELVARGDPQTRISLATAVKTERLTPYNRMLSSWCCSHQLTDIKHTMPMLEAAHE